MVSILFIWMIALFSCHKKITEEILSWRHGMHVSCVSVVTNLEVMFIDVLFIFILFLFILFNKVLFIFNKIQYFQCLFILVVTVLLIDQRDSIFCKISIILTDYFTLKPRTEKFWLWCTSFNHAKIKKYVIFMQCKLEINFKCVKIRLSNVCFYHYRETLNILFVS